MLRGFLVRVPGAGVAARLDGRTVAVSLMLGLATAVGLALSVSIGDFPIPLRAVVPAILGFGNPDSDFIVRTLRLPRALTSVLVGIAFGLSGSVFQSLARNPLASPDVIGITAGASAAAVAVIVWVGSSSTVVSLGALAGALVTATAIYLLARKRGAVGYRLVLIGIGTGAVLAAATSYMLTRAEIYDAQRAVVWLTGSLNGRGWEHVRPVGISLLVLHLDGDDIHRLPTKEVARRLGILPQQPVAPEGLTVGDLVARGRAPHQGWFTQWSAADEAAVVRALEATATMPLAARPVDELSGGQRQRAWIAMALAQGTGVMLLDEPTTYLDLAHQVEVLDLLRELNEREQRTIVLVLHDLNQACRYAHHLIAMRDGAIIAEGPPDIVVHEALVEAVFGLAVRVIPDPETGSPLVIPRARVVPHRLDDEVAYASNGRRLDRSLRASDEHLVD